MAAPPGIPVRDHTGDSTDYPVATALEIAKACALYADEIKAEDILIMDLRGLSSITDYFVICNGTSAPHLKAIRRDLAGKVQENLGEKPRSVEGDSESQWLVLDYVNVIVHLFLKDKRNLYGLENLWKDAKRVPLDFLPEHPAPEFRSSTEADSLPDSDSEE